MDPLYLIVVVLLILWLVGAVAYPVGSIVHVLLIIVLILVVFRVLRGQSL